MKKVYYFLFLLFVTLSMTSCLDSDEDDYTDWRLANEAFFQQKADSIVPGADTLYYKSIVSEAYPDYKILYREITPGTGRVPYYTSTVQVSYSGHLYNTTTKFDSGTNTEFLVSGVIAGWEWALQNMKEGAKWEVIIPWQLAYGANGSGSSIPPYSALVFEIDLTKIVKWQTGTNSDDSSNG